MADERRVTIQEMAAAIRKKHDGAYADVDDVELVKAVVSKFPAYKNQISNWSDTLQTPMTRMQDATGERNVFPVASEQQLASMPEQQPIDLPRQQPRMTTQGLYAPTAAGATPAAYVAEQFRQGNVERREPRERRPFSEIIGDVFSASQNAAIPAGSAAGIVEREQQDPFVYEGPREGMENYGRSAGAALEFGANILNRGLVNTPNHVIRWSNLVPTMIYKQLGMPDEVAAAFTNQPVDVTKWNEYFDREQKRLEDKRAEFNPDHDKGIIDAALEGNWTALFRNATEMALQSFAPSIAIAATGGALGATGTMAAGTLLFGSMQLDEIDKSHPYLPEVTKLSVATLNGAIEGIFETLLGSGAMGQAFVKMFKELPKEAAEAQVKKGFNSMMVNLITKNPYLAMVGEGVEEFFTEISQGVVNKYSGIEPELTIPALLKRASEAFVVGITAGVGHTGALYSAQAGIRTTESIKARSTERRLQAQVITDFQSAQSNLDAVIEQKPELIPLVNQIMESQKGFANRSQSLLESINGRGVDGAELSQQEVSTVLKYFLEHDQYTAMQNAKEFTKKRDLERFRAQQHTVAEEQLKAIRHEDGSIIKARVAINGRSTDTYILSGNPAIDGNSIVVIDPNTGENKMVSSNAVSKKSIQIMEQAQASEELHAHVDDRVDQQAQELEAAEEQAATTVEALIKGTVIYYDGYEGIVESQTPDGGILFIPAGMTTDDVEYIPKESIGLVEVISSPSTESMVAAGNEEVLIPRNEDGTVDYESEAMTPELLAQLYSEEFGVEDAITDLQELVAQNQEEAQNLRTSRPKGAASVSQKTENKRKAKALEEYNTKLQRAIEILQGTQQEGAQEGQQRVVQQSRAEKIVDANNPESILRNENGDPIILTKATTSAITSQKAMDLWLYENAKNYLADTSDNARAAINAMNPKKLTSFEREFLTESFFGSKQIYLSDKIEQEEVTYDQERKDGLLPVGGRSEIESAPDVVDRGERGPKGGRLVEFSEESGQPGVNVSYNGDGYTVTSTSSAGEYFGVTNSEGETTVIHGSKLVAEAFSEEAAPMDIAEALDLEANTTSPELIPDEQMQNEMFDMARLANLEVLPEEGVGLAMYAKKLMLTAEDGVTVRQVMAQAVAEYDQGKRQGLGKTPYRSRINPSANGYEVTTPRGNYNEAVRMKAQGDTGTNLWIRQSPSAVNKNRTLLVQFSSRFLYGKQALTRDTNAEYFDTLYRMVPGYDRTVDFWEIPLWMGRLSALDNNSDVYVIRSVEEAIEFFRQAGYGKISFSALDVNAKYIQQIAEALPKQTLAVGGYTNFDSLEKLDNVKIYKSVEDYAKQYGLPVKHAYDYRHFGGTKIIPRLKMSDGCKYKCAFCSVPKKIINAPNETIWQQVEAIRDLDANLVYLDDKTFGQASNYEMLPAIRAAILKYNPDFEGFIIQTTSLDFASDQKFSDEFIEAAGIKYVELGVESYNDETLTKLNKKHSHAKYTDAAMEKARRTGVKIIPNLIVGMSSGKKSDGTFWTEGRAEYENTLAWLEANSDIISHVNVYNLAIYDGTELADNVEVKLESDKNENIIEKSWQDNKEDHRWAMEKFSEFALNRVKSRASDIDVQPVTFSLKANEEQGAPMTKDQITEEVEKQLHSDEYGMVTLRHYTGVDGIRELSPAKFGTNASFTTQKRRAGGVTFYYPMEAGPTELGLGTKAYAAKVEASKLYPLHLDPLNIEAKARAKAQEYANENMGGRTIGWDAETFAEFAQPILKEMGYDGLFARYSFKTGVKIKKTPEVIDGFRVELWVNKPVAYPETTNLRRYGSTVPSPSMIVDNARMEVANGVSKNMVRAGVSQDDRSFYYANEKNPEALIGNPELSKVIPPEVKAEWGRVRRLAAFTDNQNGELRTGQWAVFTAWNPGDKQLPLEENRARNEKLRQDLEDAGYEFELVPGKYTKGEESFYIKGITAEEAIALGQKHNQESVLVPEGLLYQNGMVNPADINNIDYRATRSNMYTVFTVDGFKVRVHVPIDWNTEIPLEEAKRRTNEMRTQENPNDPLFSLEGKDYSGDPLYETLRESVAKDFDGYPKPLVVDQSGKIGPAQTEGDGALYVDIRKPVFILPDSDVVTFRILTEQLTPEQRLEIALLLEDEIVESGALEEYEGEYTSIQDVLEENPGIVNDAILSADIVMNNEDVVEILRQAGFDGAIFGTSMSDNLSVEYKPFSETQILDEDGNVATMLMIGKKGAQELDELEGGFRRMINLDQARQMEAAKKDAKTIKLATGWERGSDGLWRLEIVDDGVVKLSADDIRAGRTTKNKLGEPFMRLHELWESRELFDAWPEISDYIVVLSKDTDVDNASYTPKEATGTGVGYFTFSYDQLFAEEKNPGTMKKLILHEVQHAVQELEGFARGGSTATVFLKHRLLNKSGNIDTGKVQEFIKSEMSKIDERMKDIQEQATGDREAMGNKDVLEEKGLLTPYLRLLGLKGALYSWAQHPTSDAYSKYYYYNLSGETEARNAALRSDMDPDARRTTLLMDTEDVARADQIKIMRYYGIFYNHAMQNEDIEPQFMMMWHGSPHAFDKFSTENIGTGEGVQAFGWGLYFTDIQDIAKFYAEKLSVLSVDGKSFYDILREEASSEMSGNLMNIVLKRVTMRAESDGVSIKDYDSLINYINSGKLEDWTGGALARVVLNRQIGSVDGFYNYLSDIVDIAKKYKNKLSLSRNLYSVKIHGDKGVNDLNWLEWDQKITENIKAKIEQEIEKYGGGSVSVEGPLSRNETGQNMYEGLVDYFGGKKEASLFLLRAGIDGIRYPAESASRGATRETARGFNYVVFDENAIEIEERAQFSLTASEQINEKSSLIDSALQLTEGREKASADLLDKLQLPLKKKPRVSEVVRAASDYEKGLVPKFKILDRKSKGKMIASTRNIARMAHIIKEVALHRITMPHTEEAPNPIGWYDVMMDVCEAIILEAYPEAKTDPNLVNMWKALLAITSNGMEVSKNAELSIEALEYYIRNGRLDQNTGYTRRPTTTKKHLALINRLVNEWGIDEFIKYLGEKRLVRQIREETGASLSTRKVKDLALGASMFGPKIGEEFYGSLIGKGEKGTIDVWMIRFAKMFLGDDIGVNPKTVEKNVEELRKAIRKMDNPFIIKANNGEVAAIRMKGVTKKALMDNDDTLIEYAEEVDKVFKKNREYDGLKRQYHPVWETALTQAAKKVNTNFRADDSISDNHRDAYQRAIQMAAAQLQEQGFGVDATDVQAAVWYFIKDYMKLANTRGVDTRTFLDGLKKSADIKSRGVTNKKIDQIVNEKTKEKLPELEKKVPGMDSSFWGIGDLFRIAQGANKVNQAEKNAITDEVVTLSMMLDNSGPVKPVDGQMSLLNAMIANNENEGAIAKLRGYLQQGNVIVNGFYSPWTGITYYDVDAVARTGKTPIQMVLHEQGYHHGIRLLVPDSRALAQFHQRVADFIGEEELRNVIGDSVTFEQYSKNKAALGEEYMARMAEKIAADQVLSQKEKTIWQRFIAEIRALIKKIIYGKGEITQDGLAEIRMAALESVKGYQRTQPVEEPGGAITSISELFSGTTSTYNISTSLIPKDGPRAVAGDQEGLFSISSVDNTESASEGEAKDYMGMLKELKDKLSEHKAQGKQMLRREIVEQFIRENRPYLKMLNPGRIAPALNRVNKAARSNVALDAAIANLERVISEGMNSTARKKADAFVKKISKIKTEKRSNGIITASLLLQEDVDYKNKVAMIAVMDRDAADIARKSLEADIETYEDALENDPDNQQLMDQIADVEATLNILDMYSNLRDRPLAWVEHAIATWNADFKEMKAKFREKRNADREARMERTRRVAEDLSGSEEVLERIKLEDVIPAAKRAQSSIALEYQAMHGSISSLIHAVWRGFKSGQRSSDFYQSELYKLYMAVDRGASRKIEMHEAMMERVNNHITNTYKSVNEFKKDMDSEIEITLERQKGKGETLEYVPRTVKVKVDAALHLWASYKSEGNNRYMDNIDFMSDRHRFSQEAWEALDAALSERQKYFANLMATDFFGAEEYYDAVNAVYSRRTGRQMPRVQDYIPVAANSWKNQVPYDVNNLGIYKSVAKERRGGAYDLDRNGLYRAATKYADDVSSFAHLAEPVSDLAYTLNSRLIRSASKAMGTYDKVQRIIDLLNKGYNRDHFDGQRIINWMMSRFTATKILMNYNLLPKQLTSTIAMFDPEFGNPAETLAAFVQYITPGVASEVKATIKKLVKNHPDLKFRNITNIESLTDQRRFKINLKMYGDSPSQIARATLMTALYNPTSVGDRIAIQWGAIPVAMANYKRALKDAKKMGMDESKAESYAALAATDAMAEFINQTQQSSKLTHRSAFQYGGYRIAAAFMNSIMGYARKVTRHARGINRDYQAGFVRAMKEGDNTSVAAMKALAAIEPSKVAALFMYTTVMPVLFTTVASLGGNFARMWDDDDEERRAARLDMAFDAMLGWTKGLYGLGFFLQYAFKQTTGQFYGSKDDNITPIVDDSTELIMQLTRAGKLLAKYNDEDIKNRPEYEQKLRDALIKTGITGLGLWKGTPVTFMSRIMDVTTKEEYDDLIKVAARLYGLPVKEIERMFTEDPTAMIDPDVAPYLDASVTEFLMEMKDRDESIGKTFQPTKYARKWMAYQLFDVEQDIQARMDINMLLSSTSNQKKAELIVKRYEGYNDVMSFYEGFVHPYTQPLGEFSYFDDSGKQRSGKLRDGLMTVGMQKTMWKEISKNIERSGMTRDEKIENFSTVMAILSNISKPEEMTDYYSRLEQLQKSIE